jgi:hypothetical protein
LAYLETPLSSFAQTTRKRRSRSSSTTRNLSAIAIMAALNKIAPNSPSRQSPSELEVSLANALYDLESNTQDLKSALRPLQFVSAREVRNFFFFFFDCLYDICLLRMCASDFLIHFDVTKTRDRYFYGAAFGTIYLKKKSSCATENEKWPIPVQKEHASQLLRKDLFAQCSIGVWILYLTYKLKYAD